MNRLLLVGILVISTIPLYAHGQQPDAAKVKADAQKVARIIGADRAKTQAYCQITSLGEQFDQAIQEKDRNKLEELARKINDLEKQLGPEYLALVDALKDEDPKSKEVREIMSIFDRLDDSCPH
jgi:predicted transcriptional regulator